MSAQKSKQTDREKEDIENGEGSPQLTKFDQNQADFMLEFAKKNYRRTVSGQQIRINGQLYDVTKIGEDKEDKFAELENNLNSLLASPDAKKARKALYDFVTFATNATVEQLRECDRGELKSIALILGMIQKGFRDL